MLRNYTTEQNDFKRLFTTMDSEQKSMSLKASIFHNQGPKLTAELRKTLDKGFDKMNQQHSVRLIVVVIEEKGEDVYSINKRWGGLEKGIPTVCVTAGKLCNGPGSLLGNLALKINLKLGGANHTLPAASCPGLLLANAGGSRDTMIVGADVTHSSRASISGCPSIAGVVASIDKDFTNYPGSLRLQTSRNEMIEELRSMVRERLVAWYEHNEERLPNAILFYRDGVSESQFTHVKDRELPQIRLGCGDAFDELCKTDRELHKQDPQKPKVTLVVVGKRHRTRFFPPNDVHPDHVTEKGNFKPGLVVDSVICHPYYFDFYLQAHDNLQTTTQVLCYNYARATKAVSYVPPAYFADHLCERGRVYLRQMLTNDYTNHELPRDSTAQQVLDAAKADTNLWPTTKSSRHNPWYKNLENVMFYL